MSVPLTLQPIGFLRTPKPMKFHALHQPSEIAPEQNFLELLPDCGYEKALQDLAGFSRIWLISWFHRNKTWRPLVLPPRGPAKRRGVFATRSPHRPNPLGLTPVQLISVTGRKLILGACDLVDGTPILDIKPYIAAYDAFPDAGGGWTEEVASSLAAPPQFSVCLAPLAETQAEWLRANWQIDFCPRLFELLSRDPTPHRTRRIRRCGDAQFVIGCGAWRAVFSVAEKIVTIATFETGYPPRFLNNLSLEDLPDRAAQLAFLERWPQAKWSGG
jgi:tRNA-Thr(GGU) m(6)t(6)A37 methyltransferase TsaA